MNELEQKVYWTKGVDHGIELEQARIIALLEQASEGKYCRMDDGPEHEDCYSFIETPIYKLIALIKGEK